MWMGLDGRWSFLSNMQCSYTSLVVARAIIYIHRNRNIERSVAHNDTDPKTVNSIPNRAKTESKINPNAKNLSKFRCGSQKYASVVCSCVRYYPNISFTADILFIAADFMWVCVQGVQGVQGAHTDTTIRGFIEYSTRKHKLIIHLNWVNSQSAMCFIYLARRSWLQWDSLEKYHKIN